MKEKTWKIFKVLGIVLLFGLIIFLIANYFSLKTKPYSELSFSPPGTSFRTGFISESKERREEIFSPTETPSRMVIKNGWLSLVVKDVIDTARKISKFAEEKGGWVVSSDIYEREKTPFGNITVRVPAENFEEAVNYFRSLAVRVSHESTQSQDITEEYVDLEARLRNLESAENQLLELMKRSGEIKDILEVQKELTNVRQQIEQIKGRMQYLEQSVKMSSITVNLSLSEELLPVPPSEKWRPKYVLLQSWKSALNFWKGFSYFLIRLIVWAQVWIPFSIIVWLGIKFLKRRKK